MHPTRVITENLVSVPAEIFITDVTGACRDGNPQIIQNEIIVNLVSIKFALDVCRSRLHAGSKYSRLNKLK